MNKTKLGFLTMVTLSTVLNTATTTLVNAEESKDVNLALDKNSLDVGIGGGVIEEPREVSSDDSLQGKDDLVTYKVDDTAPRSKVGTENASVMFEGKLRNAEAGESNGDYRVSLIDVPVDGYGYKDDAKATLRINNTTGAELSNLSVRFKVKKNLIDVDSKGLVGLSLNVWSGFGSTFIDRYADSLVNNHWSMNSVTAEDPYITGRLGFNPISAGKRIDMTFNLLLSNFTARTRDLYIPSKDYLSTRDFDIDYEIVNGDQVLGRGVLPIHVKAPTLNTVQRHFNLDLTRVGRLSETNGSNFNKYTNGGMNHNVFDIVDDNDKKFWLVVKDNTPTEGLYSYVENSKFKFKIPQGFKIDEDALKLYYPGMNYSISGNTVDVTVRPGDVGLSIGADGSSIYRGFKVDRAGITNNYFALPLIKDDTLVDTYHFSVDTSSGGFPNVGDLTLNAKQTFNTKTVVDFVNGTFYYVGFLKTDNNYLYDADSVNFQSGYTYDVDSFEYDTKLNGATLKAINYDSRFFEGAKVYGIRSDGTRILLDTQKVKEGDYILGEYLKTKVFEDVPSRGVIHVPDDVVKVRFELNKKITSRDHFNNKLLWDIVDADAVRKNIDKKAYLGVNGVIKDFRYEFNIDKSSVLEYRWKFDDLNYKNRLRAYQDFDGGVYNYSIINVDTSQTRKHVIWKVPKGFSISSIGTYAGFTSADYEVKGEEVVGDNKYILISLKEGAQLNTSSLLAYLDMNPTVKDGVYDTSSRVYLEGKSTLPSDIVIKPSYSSTGPKYSFQYDPTRSIKDNYELVTDGTEARAKITVEKPKILSTFTTVNDGSSLVVKGFNEVFNVKSYITNDSSDPVVHPVLNVVVPDKLELKGGVIVPKGYKVQYKLDGRNDYTDTVSDYSLVKGYRVVAVDSTASILPNESLEVSAPMKLKKGITDNIRETINTTVTHDGGTLQSENITITSDLQEFKDGIVNVKWVDDKGVTLKTQKLTGRHGTKYVIDKAMFTKDGKYYKYVSVDGIPEGTYTGGVTSDVVVHMKEQEITFELPLTGTLGTLGVLGSLLSALGVTFARKRGR